MKRPLVMLTLLGVLAIPLVPATALSASQERPAKPVAGSKKNLTTGAGTPRVAARKTSDRARTVATARGGAPKVTRASHRVEPIMTPLKISNQAVGMPKANPRAKANSSQMRGDAPGVHHPAGGGEDGAARMGEDLQGGAAGAGRQHHDLPRLHAIEPGAQLFGRDIRPVQVELVGQPVERAVADEHEREEIVLSELRRGAADGLAQRLLRRLRTGQRFAAGELRRLSRQVLEALFVLRLAAQPGHEERAVGGAQRQTGGKEEKEPHTAPQRRRTSHSAIFSPASSRKAAGAFQTGRVSRTVMPASDSSISFTIWPASAGR